MNFPMMGVIAGYLSGISYTLYILSIFKVNTTGWKDSTFKKIINNIFTGETKPNRATWWILTLVGIMISTSYHAVGAVATIWVSITYVFGPLITAILSLKYGEGKWEKLDKWCLTVALLSAVVWYFSQSAIIVLVMNVVMDFIGLLPTIKKAYLRPVGENKRAWAMESVSGILNLFALERWTFSLAFYPVYLLTINGIVTILLFRNKNVSVTEDKWL